jgi:DNA-binding CsgD family transcriptional regulator
MNQAKKTAAALLSAFAFAREHDGADDAIRAHGVELSESGGIDVIGEDLRGLLAGRTSEDMQQEALAIGFLAGRVARVPRMERPRDPTAFFMNRDLVVEDAEGESVLRLPWFEDELFVGRQLPDISEMPTRIRDLAVETYSKALGGERGRFRFTSYGHSFTVEAVPVRSDGGSYDAVLAVATPTPTHVLARDGYERTAARLEQSATFAEGRAEAHRLAHRPADEDRERRAAIKARDAAARMSMNAHDLRTSDGATKPVLTEREREVLQLASHGMTLKESAQHLALSIATIKTHHRNAYAKLGMSDKAAAVACALRRGLIH